jgi:hypothetical protein
MIAMLAQRARLTAVLTSTAIDCVLWQREALFAVLDFLQIYSVLAYMAAVNALWPQQQWLTSSDLDLWGFMRQQNGYAGNAAAVPSGEVGINYEAYAYACLAVGPTLLLAGILISHQLLMRSDILQYARRQAFIRRVLFCPRC